jgi:lysozyme family protein
MAHNFKAFAAFVLDKEGGFVNDKLDKGKATNMGVTIATFKSQGYDNDHDGDIDVADLRLMTKVQATEILKKAYWNKVNADLIKDQSTANMIVDWYWCSGGWGAKIPQRILGLKEDGVLGPKSIAAINAAGPIFADNLYKARFKFLHDIVIDNPSQKRFINGWINRLNDLAKFNISIR